MHSHYELYFGDIVSGGASESGERFDVPASDMLTKILSRPGGDSGLLPPVVKAFTEDMQAFIVERPPTKVNMHVVLEDLDDETEFDFEIALPWMVYLINIGDTAKNMDGHKTPLQLWAYARPEQIFSEHDLLYALPLPNLANNGEVCFGAAEEGMEINKDDLTSSINMAINCLWASPANGDFNNFIWDPIKEFKDLLKADQDDLVSTHEQIKTYLEAWSRLGINDVLSLSFNPSKPIDGKTIEDFKKDLTVGMLIEWMEKNCSGKSSIKNKYYPGILFNELAAQVDK